jgi:hypothetical protein
VDVLHDVILVSQRLAFGGERLADALLAFSWVFPQGKNPVTTYRQVVF